MLRFSTKNHFQIHLFIQLVYTTAFSIDPTLIKQSLRNVYKISGYLGSKYRIKICIAYVKIVASG